MATVLPRFAAALAENPDLAYSRLVSPRKLGRERRLPRVRRARVRERPSRRAEARPAAATPDATHSAWADYPGREEGANLPVLPPLVLPHRRASATSSTSCACCSPRPVDRAGGHARHRRAATPARIFRRSPTSDSPGVLPLGGALRVPARGAEPRGTSRSASATTTGRSRIRIPSSARSPRWSTWPTTISPPPWRGSDPDPLIVPPLYGALARAHPAAADRARRQSPRSATTTGCTSSTSIRAIASRPDSALASCRTARRSS